MENFRQSTFDTNTEPSSVANRGLTFVFDVALSKASYAADCEKFLLDEIENLGKSLKCEYLDLFRCVL
jgi:hypothetical protein